MRFFKLYRTKSQYGSTYFGKIHIVKSFTVYRRYFEIRFLPRDKRIDLW